MPFLPSRSDIEQFLPGANPAWLAMLKRLAPDLCSFYGFDRLQWVHFIGQVAHESGGMKLVGMRENMSFRSPARIREVYAYRLKLCLQKLDRGEVAEPAWAKGLTIDQLCRRLVGEPEELARIVYGGREGTPWYEGHRYIGRGLTQITHRDNYAAIGAEIARQPGSDRPDLVARPDLLEQPEWGVRAAFADWELKQLGRLAAADDVDRVSAKLNTGSADKVSITNGLADRRRWVAKAKGIWPATRDSELVDARILRVGDRGPEVAAVQARLTELGYPAGSRDAAGQFDGVFGALTRRAVIAFQAEHSLKIDGEIGPRTLDALKTSAPADLGPRAALTAADLAARGSEPVQAAQQLGLVAKGTATVGIVAPVLATVQQGLGWLGIGVPSLDSLPAVLTWLDAVRGLFEQITPLFAWVGTPVGLLAIAGVVLVGLAALIQRYASRAAAANVAAARAGLDLSH